jgi:hypothetical protein
MELNIEWIPGKEGLNGFDYGNQVWIKGGKYVRCGHPESMSCNCFGRLNEGRRVIRN